MYKRPRIMPCLLLTKNELVKTTKFRNPRYLGDPINAVSIFNEKYVDELIILDISASKNKLAPNFEYLKDICSEAFMPLSYGGGITNIEEVKKLFSIGFEKVIFNTSFVNNPNLISEAINLAGSQSVVVSIDVKTDLFGKQNCYICNGTINTKKSPIELLKYAKDLGVGEIIINSIDNDGMMSGYDLKLISEVSKSVNIPIVACGGAGSIYHLKEVLDKGAHAIAAGSLFVYYGSEKAVLINFPDEKDLYELGIYQN